MKRLFVALLMLLCTAALAQTPKLSYIDSLESRQHKLKPGPIKESINTKIFYYYYNKDVKKALSVAEADLAESKRLKNDTLTCISYNIIGEAYLRLEDFNKALVYLNLDYNLAQTIGYKKQVALALCDISSYYSNQSDYPTAQKYNFRALAIYEDLKSYRQIAVCNINIGVNYTNNGDFTRAIYYANRALQLTKKIGDDELTADAYEIIGNSYGSLNNNSKAREYYLQVLAIYQKKENDSGIATALSLLMSAYPGEQKQLDYGLKAQILWNKISPDNFYSIYNLGNLGSAYGRMAMHEKSAEKRKVFFKQAESYLADAINRGQKTNTKSAIIDFKDSLATVYAAMGNYKDAYTNFKTSSKLFNSVYSQDNKNKIAALEGKHEIVLRDKQLEINKLQLNNQRKQAWILAGGIAFLIITALVLYRQNKIKQKINTQLDESNRIKTQFFGILNHDLRAPVTNFIHLLYMKQNEAGLLNEESSLAYENRIKQSAVNLLSTMEDLLLWSKGQMKNFKANPEIIAVDDLFARIKTSSQPPENIQLIFWQPPGMQLNVDPHYLQTIMYNLTNNAIKALGATNGGLITWKAWEVGVQKYLSITDNGAGSAEGAFQALYNEGMPVGIQSGLGLHIVRDLSKAIGCRLKVISKPGIGVEVQLKFA